MISSIAHAVVAASRDSRRIKAESSAGQLRAAGLSLNARPSTHDRDAFEVAPQLLSYHLRGRHRVQRLAYYRIGE